MVLTLNIPDELERELAAAAEQLGLSLPEYALHVLSSGLPMPPMPKTGAELVAYWQREGIVGSRSEIVDSQQHARELRRQAENRSSN